MTALTRRRLMQAALLGPFLPCFSRVARAQVGGFVRPKNLVLVFHPNGLEPGWKPTMANGVMQLPPVLQALEPFANRMLAVHGLHAGIRNEVAAHGEGMTSLWTGAQIPKGDAYSAYPSIDQLAAEGALAGGPLPSLELGVQSQTGFGSGDNQSVMIYSRRGKMQPEDDPDAAFRRLFGSSVSGDAVAKVRAQRQSVLDLVKSDLPRLRGDYSAGELAKLDAHVEGVRALEQRLDDLAALRCETSHVAHGLGNGALNDTANFARLAGLQTEMVVTALRCNVTRVVSLQLSNSVSDRRISGVNPSLGVHATMHAGTRAERVNINRYFVGVVASLVQKLSDAQLLDDTLVVWGSEMAIGNHLRNPVPFFVFGGRANEGYFKQGAVLELSQPHRTMQLLQSVLTAVGVPPVGFLGDLNDETSRGVLPGASRVES